MAQVRRRGALVSLGQPPLAELRNVPIVALAVGLLRPRAVARAPPGLHCSALRQPSLKTHANLHGGKGGGREDAGKVAGAGALKGEVAQHAARRKGDPGRRDRGRAGRIPRAAHPLSQLKPYWRGNQCQRGTRRGRGEC